MARRRTQAPLRSGGFLWGPQRVAAGITLSELEKRTKISRGFISRMENGVMIPSGAEYHRITSALADITAERQVTIEQVGAVAES